MTGPEDKRKNTRTCRSTCAQMFATFALNTTSVTIAMIIGMPVLVIGALRLRGDSFQLTDEEASWFGGLVLIVQPVGSVLSGVSQDALGRKTCLMVVCVPKTLGWLMLYSAKSVYTLFVAEVLLGLCIGFIQAASLSYIGETTEPRLRGVLSTLGIIFLNAGFIAINSIGAATDWRAMCLISSGGPLISLLALALIPESPAWLVAKGRVEDAGKAYQWLRGWVPPQAVKEELDTLVTYVEETRRIETTKESQLKIFLHSSVQRPLLLITVYFFFGSCASLMATRTFIIEVLADLESPLRPNVAVILFTALTLVGSLTSTALMRRLGKRGLTFLSLGPCVASCLLLSLYLELGARYPWVPFLLFSVNYFAAGIGVMGVPWILVSELFPFKARGFASGVAGAVGFLSYFIVIKTYFNVVNLVGTSAAYFVYGTIGAVGFCYLYKNLPETEGLSLEDIERFFQSSIKEKSSERAEFRRKTKCPGYETCTQNI